jgi:hypothetical protein
VTELFFDDGDDAILSAPYFSFRAPLGARPDAVPGAGNRRSIGSRLLREICEQGYAGGYTAVTDFRARFGRRPARPSTSGSRRRRVTRHRLTSHNSKSSSPTSSAYPWGPRSIGRRCVLAALKAQQRSSCSTPGECSTNYAFSRSVDW